MNFTTEIMPCVIGGGGVIIPGDGNGGAGGGGTGGGTGGGGTGGGGDEPIIPPGVTVMSMVVSPDFGTVETNPSGQGLKLRCYAELSNDEKLDVSQWCTWSSNRQDVLVNSGGIVTSTVQTTGCVGGAPAAAQLVTAMVSASYKGSTATATIYGQSACEAQNSYAIDCVLILDRKRSMAAADIYGVSRLTHVNRAAYNVITNMRSNRDRLGIVAFSSEANVGTSVVLSALRSQGQQQQLLSAIDNYALDTNKNGNYSCPAAGIIAAVDLLKNSATGTKRVAIMITDMGTTQFVSPHMSTALAAAQAAQVELQFIGIELDSQSQQELSDAAATDKYNTRLLFTADKADDAIGIASQRLVAYCEDKRRTVPDCPDTGSREIKLRSLDAIFNTSGEFQMVAGSAYAGFLSPVFSFGGTVPTDLEVGETTGLITWTKNTTATLNAVYNLTLTAVEASDSSKTVTVGFRFNVKDAEVVAVNCGCPNKYIISDSTHEKHLYAYKYAADGVTPAADFSYKITRGRDYTKGFEDSVGFQITDVAGGDVNTTLGQSLRLIPDFKDNFALSGEYLQISNADLQNLATNTFYSFRVYVSDSGGDCRTCADNVNGVCKPVTWILNVKEIDTGTDVRLKRICDKVDKVGMWNQWGPDGDGSEASKTDYHWQLEVDTSSSELSIKSIVVEGCDDSVDMVNHSKQVWSTKESKYYPALVVYSGKQNRAYSGVNGTIKIGSDTGLILNDANGTLADSGKYRHIVDIYGAIGAVKVGYGYGGSEPSETDVGFKVTIDRADSTNDVVAFCYNDCVPTSASSGIQTARDTVTFRSGSLAQTWTFYPSQQWQTGLNNYKIPIVDIPKWSYRIEFVIPGTVPLSIYGVPEIINGNDYGTMTLPTRPYIISLPGGQSGTVTLILTMDPGAESVVTPTTPTDPVDVYYNISLDVYPVGSGDVTGWGSFLAGSRTVTAIAASGWVFSNWKVFGTGEVMSVDAAYTFYLQSNVSLMANFTPIA